MSASAPAKDICGMHFPLPDFRGLAATDAVHRNREQYADFRVFKSLKDLIYRRMPLIIKNRTSGDAPVRFFL